MAALTNTITADGSYEFSTDFKIGTLFIKGTFGGGTLTFEQGFDGINYLLVPSGTFTSDTMTNFMSSAPHGRLVLTGATTPNLQVYVKGVIGY